MQHSHIGRTVALRRLTKLTGQNSIRLNGDDLIDLARQRKGATTQSRPNLDDKVTGLERGRSNECLCDLRFEKVLSETTPSLVSWRPPDRGHGPSLRYPWGPSCLLMKDLSRSWIAFQVDSPGLSKTPAPIRREGDTVRHHGDRGHT